jgi:hypothetical protein
MIEEQKKYTGRKSQASVTRQSQAPLKCIEQRLAGDQRVVFQNILLDDVGRFELLLAGSWIEWLGRNEKKSYFAL